MNLFTRAKILADWLVLNQVNNSQDANYGRFANEIRPKGPESLAPYSVNWMTGMALISLLMMYQRTRDRRYLHSARAAGQYLKSLQFLDARFPHAFGLFREETPQTNWCHPRDALSAAWSLLHLSSIDRDADAMLRAVLFAKWFKQSAMQKGYPAWTAYIEKGKEPFWRLGSFHGGSPLFFFDLYQANQDKQWLKTGLIICDTWINHFLKEDGSIRIEIDHKTGKDLTGKGPSDWHVMWQDMHKTNDDFTSLALIRAYQLTGKRHYLSCARRFLDWALTIQRNDGAFGDPPVNSAAPVLILELKALYKVTGEEKYLNALKRSIPHFLSLQELKLRNSLYHGGFYCLGGGCHNTRVELGVRTSSYALAALLNLERNFKYRFGFSGLE